MYVACQIGYAIENIRGINTIGEYHILNYAFL